MCAENFTFKRKDCRLWLVDLFHASRHLLDSSILKALDIFMKSIPHHFLPPHKNNKELKMLYLIWVNTEWPNAIKCENVRKWNYREYVCLNCSLYRKGRIIIKLNCPGSFFFWGGGGGNMMTMEVGQRAQRDFMTPTFLPSSTHTLDMWINKHSCCNQTASYNKLFRKF